MNARSKRNWRGPVALVVLSLASGCRLEHVPAVRYYIRSEAYTPEHGDWARANCALVSTISTEYPGIDPSLGPANYALVLDTLPDVSSLGYACPIDPPWPREDGKLVAKFYGSAHRANEEDRTQCELSEDEGLSERDAGVTIERPGSGATPTDAAFIQVRASRVLPGETEPLEPTRLYVRHINCLPFARLLHKLRVGGKGTMNVASDSLHRVWHVELLQVGDEALFKASLGYGD